MNRAVWLFSADEVRDRKETTLIVSGDSAHSRHTIVTAILKELSFWTDRQLVGPESQKTAVDMGSFYFH